MLKKGKPGHLSLDGDRSLTPLQLKNIKNNNNNNKISNSNANNHISGGFKDSPIKNFQSFDNIILPQKKLKKKILYMSDITKIGFSGQNNKKVNQDNFFIYRNFNNDPHSIYLGVW